MAVERRNSSGNAKWKKFTVNKTPNPQAVTIEALQKLGIHTVTDVARYADKHGLTPSEVLEGAR